jgi:hypothetical protein
MKASITQQYIPPIAIQYSTTRSNVQESLLFIVIQYAVVIEWIKKNFAFMNITLFLEGYQCFHVFSTVENILSECLVTTTSSCIEYAFHRTYNKTIQLIYVAIFRVLTVCIDLLKVTVLTSRTRDHSITLCMVLKGNR